MSDQPEGKAEPKHASAQEPQPNAWLKTELARNAQRPYPMDFIRTIFADLSEIHGDRNFADDPAMQCSMARFHGEEVLVVSNVKGRTTKDNVKFNFGLPNPEGYRKALRVMRIAEKFGRSSLSSTCWARIPAWVRKSAGRARQLRATCWRCRASKFRPLLP